MAAVTDTVGASAGPAESCSEAIAFLVDLNFSGAPVIAVATGRVVSATFDNANGRML